MKKPLILIILLLCFKSFAQNDPKIAFQKSRYDLALSCYKKADFKKALDLFSVASRIKPENEVGRESIKKVDSLKIILRKNILDKAIGTWKMAGDKPVWSSTATDNSTKEIDEFVEITQNQISFYEVDKETKTKKLLHSEALVYYNKDASDAVFSDVILSDGTIWSCLLSEDSNTLHVINIAKKDETGVQKITSDNLEHFYTRVK
ncbi:tetratricopeptide repeat protein [Flavobacterium sp. KJJ]|uniref:tetratricopeptide repeat protein n=1 Tax=Flavobacterium sp. KJJ TaxID=1270193 RepID=UPI0004934CF1|nr:tetratricopeptide repeat protein [Flavobacterium sp. KJJ]